MSPAPFRIIQAAVPSLDWVPTRWSRQISPAVLRTSVRSAFETLIDQAIASDADCVLLFPGQLKSARSTLHPPGFGELTEYRQQLSRLTGRGITIVLVPPHGVAGWEAFESDSIQRLVGDHSQCEISRAGRTWRFSLSNAAEHTTTIDASVPVTSAVRVEQVVHSHQPTSRYFALGGTCRHTEETVDGIRHHCGLIQPLDPHHTGTFGASIVRLGDGHPKIELVHTAALRACEFQLTVDRFESPDDTALRMLERIAETKPQTGEKAWHIRWLIEEDRCRNSTSFGSFRDDLLLLLPSESEGVELYHDIHLITGPANQQSTLVREFVAALHGLEESMQTPAGRLNMLHVESGNRHFAAMQDLAGAVEMKTVMRLARAAGQSLASDSVEPAS